MVGVVGEASATLCAKVAATMSHGILDHEGNVAIECSISARFGINAPKANLIHEMSNEGDL